MLVAIIFTNLDQRELEDTEKSEYECIIIITAATIRGFTAIPIFVLPYSAALKTTQDFSTAFSQRASNSR